MVLDKAEGIFLWVDLALKLLLRGLDNKDSWETMEKRLNLLSKTIESLYSHMWSRLGKDQKLYRVEAASYFRLILVRQMSLLEFVIATNEHLQSTLLDLTSTSSQVGFCSICEDAKSPYHDAMR